MANNNYDVVIVGAGSGGGFLAGQIAPNGSLLSLDAGPSLAGAPNPGKVFFSRRTLATTAATTQREARLVGGVSATNVGAWLRPRTVDRDGFNRASRGSQRTGTSRYRP
jgi:choline dehydrogenase-like flavoprotein